MENQERLGTDGYGQHLQIEILGLIQNCLVRLEELSNREASPVATVQKGVAFDPDYEGEFKDTLFQSQELLADYETRIQRLAKKIPGVVERAGLRVHSRALWMFKGFCWLTVANASLFIGHLVVHIVKN